jgi:hypothetical protein
MEEMTAEQYERGIIELLQKIKSRTILRYIYIIISDIVKE